MRRAGVIALLLLSSFWPEAGRGEASASLALIINHVDGSHFPVTVGYVTALGARGYPVLGLDARNFQVTEDGIPVTGLQVASAVNVEEPLAAVLTIDTSGSMTHADLAQEKAAAIAFVQGLRPQDQVAVVAFSTHVQRLTGFTANREVLAGAINELQPGGNTALYDALWDSVELSAEAPALRRVVILMTDGVNTASRASLDDGLNLAVRERTAVYTIGLGRDLDRNVLSRVAQKTGGTSLIAPTPGDLHQAYDRIATELRSQYLLRYTSPRPRGARDYHVAVRVAAAGDQARAEVKYRPSPAPPVISTVSLADGETIIQPVSVDVEATSEVPIAVVRLIVNGRPLAEASSPPYSLLLNPTQVSPGRQELTISVTNTAGSEAVKRIYAIIPPHAAGDSSQPELGPSWDVPGRNALPVADVLRGLAQFLGFSQALSGWEHMRDAVSTDIIEGLRAGLPDARGLLASLDPTPSIAGLGDSATTAVATLLSPVTGTAESAANTVKGAGATVGGWWQAAEARARAHAHRVPSAGLALLAGFVGVVEARRLLDSLRRALGRVTCSACDHRYAVYQGDCPVCLERRRQRDLKERRLEEVLLRNKLVPSEPLSQAVAVSQRTGRPLEEVVLEQDLISPGDLAKARYYLAHSVEIRSRLTDLLGRKDAHRPPMLPPRLTALRGAAILIAIAACGFTLPAVLG